VASRREILKYAGLGVGAATASALGLPVNPKVAVNQTQPPSKPAQTEVTDKSGKRLAAGAEIVWAKIAKKAAPADVTVDPAKPAQTILGFGAAFTDASCFTLSRLSDSDHANLLHTMFGQDQHALSIGRIPIGASDYSTAAYSYDDGAADPEVPILSLVYRRTAKDLWARNRIRSSLSNDTETDLGRPGKGLIAACWSAGVRRLGREPLIAAVLLTILACIKSQG